MQASKRPKLHVWLLVIAIICCLSLMFVFLDGESWVWDIDSNVSQGQQNPLPLSGKEEYELELQGERMQNRSDWRDLGFQDGERAGVDKAELEWRESREFTRMLPEGKAEQAFQAQIAMFSMTPAQRESFRHEYLEGYRDGWKAGVIQSMPIENKAAEH